MTQETLGENNIGKDVMQSLEKLSNLSENDNSLKSVNAMDSHELIKLTGTMNEMNLLWKRNPQEQRQ